jgi:hypothetical protein
MKKIKISYFTSPDFGFLYLYTDNKTFIDRVYTTRKCNLETYSETFSHAELFLNLNNDLTPTTYNSLRSKFGKLPKVIKTAPIIEGWVK